MSVLLGRRVLVRVVAAVGSLGLVAGFATLGASTASASTPVPKAPPIVDAPSAAGQADASAIARKFGHSVVVSGSESATTLISALPNGSMQLSESAVPVRAKVAGGWKPVDLTLGSTGGYLVPAVSAQSVEFSLGGDGPMARVQDGTGAWIYETAPFGALPKPSVAGATATYADVLPGVDLQLTATATGMSEVLVVNTAAAAANPALAAVKFGIIGSAVTADSNGVAHAGAKGEAGITAGTPLWWDSSQGSTAAGPGGTLIAQPVAQAVTGDAVTIDVAAAAQTAGVQYPVFVDPPWSRGDTHAWFIDADIPNQAYVDANPYATVEKSGWIPASATGSGGIAHLTRSFWSFDTSALAGKVVSAAQLGVTLNSAFNCSIMRQANLWSTTNPAPASWNGTGNVWTGVIGSAVPGGCGAAVGFNALAAAQSAAASGVGTTVLSILASNESDEYNWQKWNMGATFSATYDTYPNTPTGLTFVSPAVSCSTNSSQPTYLDGTQPITVAANSTDSDGDALATTIAVHGVTTPSYSWSTTSASQAGGTTAPISLPTSWTAGEYSMTAQSFDGTLHSSVSAPCYFQIELTPPALPTITVLGGQTQKVGKPLTVSIASTAADNVAVFAVWWVDNAQTIASTPPVTTPITPGGVLPTCGSYDQGVHYVCPDSGTTNVGSLTVAPIDRTSTLMVTSYDHAGRPSVGSNGSSAAAKTITATADTAGVAYNGGHLWDSTGYPLSATTIADQATSTATTGTTAPQLLIGATLTPASLPAVDAPALQLTAGSSTPAIQEAHTATSPTDPSSSYTITFWAQLSSGASGTLLSQAADFSDAPGGPAWGTLFKFNATASGVQFCINRTYGTTTCTNPVAVPVNQWIQITGIWDTVNHQARILIGDDMTPKATTSTTAASTITQGGPLATGQTTVTATGAYAGSVNTAGAQVFQPATYPGVISANQLDALNNNTTGPNGEDQTAFTPPTISAGSSHACSLSNGQVSCWGANSYGQLGNGTTTNSDVPVVVAGALANRFVTSVSAGAYETCAIANGQAYCWGANFNGDLGDGTATWSYVPVAVSTSGALAGKTVTSVVAGNGYACAIADGALYCWGGNDQGELGNGTTTSSNVPVLVAGALAGRTVDSVSTGDWSTCAVADGQAFCWGDNSEGELGNDTYTNSSSPVAVDNTGNLAGKTVTAVAVETTVACALADGEPYCWGYGDEGELGYAPGGWYANFPVPVDVSGVLAGKTITSISASDRFDACVVADGQVYCWGWNTDNELGGDLPTMVDVPTAADPTGVLSGMTVTSVAAGEFMTCAVADGQIYCWGGNDQGQLGDGSTTDSDVPVAVS